MLYNYSIGRLKTGNILDIESDDIVYSSLADTYYVCLELEPGTYIHQVQLLQSVHFVSYFLTSYFDNFPRVKVRQFPSRCVQRPSGQPG